MSKISKPNLLKNKRSKSIKLKLFRNRRVIIKVRKRLINYRRSRRRSRRRRNRFHQKQNQMMSRLMMGWSYQSLSKRKRACSRRQCRNGKWRKRAFQAWSLGMIKSISIRRSKCNWIISKCEPWNKYSHYKLLIFNFYNNLINRYLEKHI